MKLIICVALCLISKLAIATDGNRLLAICAPAEKTEWTSDEFQHLAVCYSYIDGVLDANDFWHSMLESENNHRHDKSKICPASDGGINTEQGARIVLKYLKDNPDKLHYPGAILVLNALHSAFPCK